MSSCGESVKLEKTETVLDTSCEAGIFRFMAATRAAKVVASAKDTPSFDRLYWSARARKSTVFSLQMDISNPSHSISWRNRNRMSSVGRVDGLECAFAMAAVHSLLATNGIPHSEVENLYQRLTARNIDAGLVGTLGLMFQCLRQGRDDRFARLSLEEQNYIFTERFIARWSHRLTMIEHGPYMMGKR